MICKCQSAVRQPAQVHGANARQADIAVQPGCQAGRYLLASTSDRWSASGWETPFFTLMRTHTQYEAPRRVDTVMRFCRKPGMRVHCSDEVGVRRCGHLCKELLALGRLHAERLRQHHRQQVGLFCAQCPSDDRCVGACGSRCVYVVALHSRIQSSSRPSELLMHCHGTCHSKALSIRCRRCQSKVRRVLHTHIWHRMDFANPNVDR